MDLFKSQFDRIVQQLSALTPSQKMLTAATVAIMVMTLVWWGRYAGEPEMEPLLPQAISADELPRVEMELDAEGDSPRHVGRQAPGAGRSQGRGGCGFDVFSCLAA